MRCLLVALALLSAAGCDSSDSGPVPYDGIVEVSLGRDADGRAVLHLVTAGIVGCSPRLVVETDASATRLGVRVVGVEQVQEMTECLVAYPASADVPLPFEGQGAFPVGVEHRGADDAYTYSIGFAGERLDAVRTSTTRLAAP